MRRSEFLPPNINAHPYKAASAQYIRIKGANMKKIRKCASCGSYTLKEECHNMQTKSAHPPKWNPFDKYADIRRKEKGISR
jgi:rRNA maturation protein Nop10